MKSPGLLHFVLTVLCSSVLTADIIYVMEGRGGSGISWSSAHDDLEDALDSAGPGDEIRIAAGTYRPGEWPHNTTARTDTFVLVDRVTIRGGYPPTGGAVSNPDLYPTILTGEIGAAGNADNSYHVVTATGVAGESALLENVTITGGNANGSAALRQHVGAGFFSDGSGSSFLNNVIITGNTATGVGAGVYLNSSFQTFTNCTFSNNTIPVDGAGVLGEGAAAYHNLCDPVYTNCTFLNNSAADYGGAVSSHNSSPDYTGCTFENNTSVKGGGAIYNIGSGGAVSHCTFTGNSGTATNILVWGGAIYNDMSNLMIEDCSFTGNFVKGLPAPVQQAWGGGGAIANRTSAPTILRCSFEENSSDSTGGALFNDVSPVSVNHCAFYKNSAVLEGGAMYNVFSSSTSRVIGNSTFVGNTIGSAFGSAIYNLSSDTIIQNCSFAHNDFNIGDPFLLDLGTVVDLGDSNVATVINCVFWDNGRNADGEALDLSHSSSNPVIRYCLIEGMNPNDGSNSFGNLDGTDSSNDPLFAPYGDYGGPTKTIPLLPNSPAIDPHNGSTPTVQGLVDQRGFPRLVDITLDIGAVESQGADDLFNVTFFLDRDGDGYSDGLEAVIGTNPLVPEINHPNRLRAVRGPSGPQLQVFIARDDLLPRFANSPDLQDWTPDGDSFAPGWITRNLPSSGSGYYRLIATRPPFAPATP